MTPHPNARSRLRAATAAHHGRVDAAFAGFDLGRRHQYVAFLQAQAQVLLPVEAAIDHARPETVLHDWPARRRSQLLLADLAALNAKPVSSVDLPCYDSAEATLGAIYVLEGSRLGGRLLARAVHSDLPRSFLDAGEPALWHCLIEVLDRALVSDAQLSAASAAACEVFVRFEASARLHRGGKG